MKKCASCTKDLPDAALHCVFCGAKQPPAPAPQAMAKTVMGYDASAQIEQLRQQAQRPGTPQPQSPPMGGPPPGMGGSPPGMGGPMGGPPGMGGPGHVAQAPTMFAGGPPPGMGGPQPPMGGPPPGMGGPMGGPPPGMGGPMGGPPPGMGGRPMGGPPMGGGMGPPMGGMGAPMGGPPMGGPPMGGPPMGGGMGPPPMGGMGPQPMGMHGGMGGPAPIAPIQQYQGTHGHAGTARAGRPVEPWQDNLRLLMIVFGVILVVAFLIPASLKPDVVMRFKEITDGTTAMKLQALLTVAVGALAIALAFMPMQTFAKGLIIGLLGLAGIVVPVVAGGDVQWQLLVVVLGMATLVPGLLLRSQYREDTFARIMVTIGVVMVLLPLLVPQNGAVPLVEMLKRLGDNIHTSTIVALVSVVIAILSLLAWLPAPSGGGAFVFAWIWIAVLPIATELLDVVARGHIGDAIQGATNATLIGWGPTVGFLGLTGYGLASAIAKKLE